MGLRDPGSVSYSAAIETVAMADTGDLSAFAKRVEREATRRGFHNADRKVIVADGAHWIWNVAGEIFPGAIQIVDRFHAKEHLSKAFKAIWGPESLIGKEWLKERYDELDAGEIEKLLRSLDIHAPYEPEAQICLDYVGRNTHRMRYADFHKQGLCTSSGVVEAGCKLAIGVRLKRGGMHWTVRGADAIIALRCCRLSKRFEDFWERRNESRLAA